MTAKYVVAYDGSDHAEKALDLAASQAQANGAELIVLHVVKHEGVPKQLKQIPPIVDRIHANFCLSLTAFRHISPSLRCHFPVASFAGAA